MSHDSLIRESSLSASSFGKKKPFLGIIVLVFFAYALSHYKEMTVYYVKLKYQAKPRTVDCKVVATLKCVDPSYVALIPLRY